MRERKESREVEKEREGGRNAKRRKREVKLNVQHTP